MVPARITQALAPWLFGLALDSWGAGALGLSAAIGLAALGALALLRGQTDSTCAIPAGAATGFPVPLFVVGYLLAYTFGVRLGWLPVQGFVPLAEDAGEFLRHLVLPATTLAFIYAALIARTTRASMIEALSQDFVRTARAKGLGMRRILFLHALKNAAVPVLTVIGIGFAALVGGAVVTETVFAIPGLGRLTVDSILRRDYPVIQGVVLIFSFVYVLINLLVDLSYMLVDPRVRY